MMADPAKPNKKIESSTSGYDESKRAPATPSERPEWEKQRHADALAYHTQQNERAGMAEAEARRNQYCPSCKGVVDWKSERCPHCGAAIPKDLRDYYNFSDFEAPVDRKELLPILTVFGIFALVAGGLALGGYFLVRWLAG
jgi:hypothetical protein